MIAPNKVVTLQDSALSVAPLILEHGPLNISIGELFSRLAKKGIQIERFMLAMDILFLLGRVSLDPESGVVSYAP